MAEECASHFTHCLEFFPDRAASASSFMAALAQQLPKPATDNIAEDGDDGRRDAGQSVRLGTLAATPGSAGQRPFRIR
jgi:hypothetical protein